MNYMNYMNYRYIGILCFLLSISICNIFGETEIDQPDHIISYIEDKETSELNQAKGGVLNFDNNRIKLSVPASELGTNSIAGKSITTETVEISAQKVELNYDIEDFTLNGEAYNFEPHGLEFDEPVELTLPYEAKDDSTEKFINIYYYNTETENWEIMPKVDQDFENNTITVKINHFSNYAPGSGSYVINEGMSPNAGYISNQGEHVDRRTRILYMDATDITLKGIGVDFALRRIFESDEFWGKIDKDFSKDLLIDKSRYEIAAGWRWALPEFFIKGASNTAEFITENSRVYKLESAFNVEGPLENGMWIEGYRVYDDPVTYSRFGLNETYTRFIELIEEKIVLECELNDPDVGFSDIKSIKAYYPDGRIIKFNVDYFNESLDGVISEITDASGKNKIKFEHEEYEGTSRLKKVIDTVGRNIIFNYSSTDITITLNGTYSPTTKLVSYTIAEDNDSNNKVLSDVVYGHNIFETNDKSKTVSFSYSKNGQYSSFQIDYQSGKTSAYNFTSEDIREPSSSTLDRNRVEKNSISVNDEVIKTFTYVYCSDGHDYDLLGLFDNRSSTFVHADTSFVFVYEGPETPNGAVQKIMTEYEYDDSDYCKDVNGIITIQNNTRYLLKYKGIVRVVSKYNSFHEIEERSLIKIAPNYYKTSKTKYFKCVNTPHSFYNYDTFSKDTLKYETSKEYDDYGQVVLAIGPEKETTYYDYVKFSFNRNKLAANVYLDPNMPNISSNTLMDDEVDFDYLENTVPYEEVENTQWYDIGSWFSTEYFQKPLSDTSTPPGYLTINRDVTMSYVAKAYHAVIMNTGFYATAENGFEAKTLIPDSYYNQAVRMQGVPGGGQETALKVHNFGLVSRIRKVNGDKNIDSYFLYNTDRTISESGVLKESTDAGDVWLKTNYTYNDNGQLSSVTDPEGNVLNVEYGTDGYKRAYVMSDKRKIRFPSEDKRDFKNVQLINSFDYDVLGRMTEKNTYYSDQNDAVYSDESENVYATEPTYYSYDKFNRVVKVLSNDILVKRYFYNERTMVNNNDYDILVTIDAEGQVILTQYDALDRLIKQETFVPYVEVDIKNRYFKSSIIDGIDYERATYADIVQSLKNVVCSLDSKKYTYDSRHIQNIKSVKSCFYIDGEITESTTEFTYDSLGRKSSTIVDGRKTLYKLYDDTLNTEQIWAYKDREGSEKTWSYIKKDWSGRVIETKTSPDLDNASNYIISNMVYDSIGNLLSKTMTFNNKEMNQHYSYSYDLAGNLKEIIYPDLSTETFKYDNNNKLIRRTDKKGNITRIFYDSLGSPRTTTISGNDSVIWNYTIKTDYNHLGLPTDIKTENGNEILSVYDYIYDSRGRLTEETLDLDGPYLTENEYTIKRQYDSLSAVTRMDVAISAGLTKSFEYVNPYARKDQEILKSDIRVKEGNNYSNLATVTHTGLGGIDTLEYGNQVIDYGNYDYFFRPREISFNGVIDEIKASYDYLGNITTYNNKEFTYDAFGRMQSGDGVIYNYDELSNRTELNSANSNLSYTYNENNKMLLEKVTDKENYNTELLSFEYDKAGNQISRTDNNGVTWYYTYDSRNQLVAVYKESEIVGEYTYDNTGHRIKKVENGETSYYIYDGNNVLYEKKSNNSGETHKLNVIFEGLNIASYTGAKLDDMEYYLLDHLGSRKAVLHENGDLKKKVDFSVWGDPKGNSSRNDINYTGKSFDSSTGLIYFNSRFYDPAIGRFINEDPAQAGDNWYVYCSNNPLGRTDPTGLVDIAKKVSNGIPLVGTYMTKYEIIPFGGDYTSYQKDLKALFNLISFLDCSTFLKMGGLDNIQAKFGAFNSGKKYGHELNTDIDLKRIAEEVSNLKTITDLLDISNEVSGYAGGLAKSLGWAEAMTSFINKDRAYGFTFTGTTEEYNEKVQLEQEFIKGYMDFVKENNYGITVGYPTYDGESGFIQNFSISTNTDSITSMELIRQSFYDFKATNSRWSKVEFNF